MFIRIDWQGAGRQARTVRSTHTLNNEEDLCDLIQDAWGDHTIEGTSGDWVVKDNESQEVIAKVIEY